MLAGQAARLPPPHQNKQFKPSAVVENGIILFEGGLCSIEKCNRSETLAHRA